MTTTIDKPVPHSDEAERGIFGSVLLDNTVLPAISDKLAIVDFFQLSNRRIYAAMLRLYKAGTAIDTVTLMDELRSELEASGGPAYLSSLAEGLQAPRANAVLCHVEIIRKHAIRRQLIHDAEATREAAFAGEDPAEIISRSRKKLGEFEPATSAESMFDTPSEIDEAPALEFAVKGFLQCYAATLLAGLSNDYKTWVALSIVKALLGDSTRLWDTFSVEHKAQKIVYLVPESSRSQFKYHLETMQLMPYVRSERLLVRTLTKGPAPSLIDPQLLAVASGSDIVLDTAVRFMSGDENKAGDNARGLAADIFALGAAGARSIIAIAHSPKEFKKQNFMELENMVRGSGDIGAMFSSAWGLRKLAGDVVHIQNIKERDFDACGPFQLAARPYLSDAGDFKLHKAPFACGSLAEEMPDVRQGGARQTQIDARKSNIERMRQYLDDTPKLTDNQIVCRFAEDDIHVNRTTVVRYRKEINRQ